MRPFVYIRMLEWFSLKKSPLIYQTFSSEILRSMMFALDSISILHSHEALLGGDHVTKLVADLMVDIFVRQLSTLHVGGRATRAVNVMAMRKFSLRCFAKAGGRILHFAWNLQWSL